MNELDDIKARAAEYESEAAKGFSWTDVKADLDRALAIAEEHREGRALAASDCLLLKKELDRFRDFAEQENLSLARERNEARAACVRRADEVTELTDNLWLARASVLRFRTATEKLLSDAHLAGLVGLTMVQEVRADTESYEEWR